MSILHKKACKKVTAFMLVGLLIGFALLQVASAVFGNQVTIYAGNNTYYGSAEAAISWNAQQTVCYAWGSGYVQTSNGASVPIGYLGAQGVLYKYNGSNSYTYQGSSALTFNQSVRSDYNDGFSKVTALDISYAADGTAEGRNPQTLLYSSGTLPRTANVTAR